MATPAPRIGTLLVLGRVSNLPTIWSNCLAGWLLNGGGSGLAFLLLASGVTLLYVGGMFLNDAFDAEFDREFRRERPIPSGQIAVREVWWIGGELLFFGWFLLFLVGNCTALLALALVAAIVLYDALHKRTEAAPVLMAVCRFLVYLLAGAATLGTLRSVVIWQALALAAYVIGLSSFARRETEARTVPRWPIFFLAATLVLNFTALEHRNLLAWLAFAGLVAWLGWCGRALFLQANPKIGRLVPGLLAGIVLVDCAAQPQLSLLTLFGFGFLFVFALLLQRIIPAT